MFSRVLIVCIGNICRSPMAAALFRERSTASGLHVDSAGLQACTGHGVEATAQEVLDDNLVPRYEHRACQVTLQQLHWAELILVMESTHMRSLFKLAPEVRGKVCLMGKWRDDMDIADPFRRPKAAFIESYERLCVDDWLPHLGLRGPHA
jgi:protein-tyrosine phosphatase